MNNTLNIFDASVISQTAAEHEMTRDELVEELRPKLEDILKSRFSGNSQKQQIKVYKDRISFAAPCC